MPFLNAKSKIDKLSDRYFFLNVYQEDSEISAQLALTDFGWISAVKSFQCSTF